MIMLVGIYALLLLLLVFAFACLRISNWHTRESQYWSEVHIKVLLDPRLDLMYRPILEWVQINKPSLLQRLLSWRPPELRMMDAHG